MSDTLVEIRCPRCKNTWHVDVATLGKPDQVIYRDPQRRVRVETYRVRCPQCSTYPIVDIEVEEADDG